VLEGARARGRPYPAPMHPTAPARASGLLTLSDGQGIAWEEHGRPDGVPVVYLHGGPGGTLGARGHLRRLDPARYRIIGFDQRGCGGSGPLAGTPEHDLAASTVSRLLADLEELRAARGVEAWLVHGVSWGSTLALAYAQAHPDRVLGLVLLAVTGTSRAEVEWITEGVGALYPEEWDRFAAHAEAAGPVRADGARFRRGDTAPDRVRLVEAYAALLQHEDPRVRDDASHAWARWEDVHVAIGAGTAGAGDLARDPRWEDDAYRRAFVTLTTHFWAHDGFLDPPVLDRMERIGHLPGVLLHGRRDVSGPVRTAWELHRRWPASRLVVDEGAGHGGSTLGESCRAALDELGDRFGGLAGSGG
jgi:proline iminopeptidase